MARLVVASGKLRNEVIELNLGVNRFGRGPANDFQLDDTTISTHHCEIILGDDGVMVRDKNSTNGTFLNGQRVQEARLQAGQILQLGALELLIETTDVTVAIPQFQMKPAPVTSPGGSLACQRHPRNQVSYRCTHCQASLCEACLHRLRRRGGKLHLLCPLCSYPCEPIGGGKKKKQSFIARVWEKTRTTLLRHPLPPNRSA